MTKQQLYAVYYDNEFEVVTNNFDKWLIQHNETRKSEGNRIEDQSEFTVEEITPIIFDTMKNYKIVWIEIVNQSEEEIKQGIKDGEFPNGVITGGYFGDSLEIECYHEFKVETLAEAKEYAENFEVFNCTDENGKSFTEEDLNI